MSQIIAALTTIALLDSTSMITVATVPMIMFLSSRRPLLLSASFVGGIFLTYFAMSVLVFMGLDSLFDAAGRWFARWSENPRTVCLVAQIVIGAAMLIVAVLMMKPGRLPPGRQPKSISPTGVFAFASLLIFIGLPGAIPLFAAVDLLIRAEVSTNASLWALVYYNAVFVLPFAAMVIVRLALGERGNRVLEAVSTFLSAWGKRLVIVVLLLLGMALIADGVGWLAGRALIPIE